MQKLLFALCLLMLLPAALSAQEQAPVGEIAFASDRGGTYQIYLMNADGSDQRPLTDGTRDAFLPLWSPDGERLVYFENTTGDPLSERPPLRLMVMNADGSDAQELARDPENGFIMNPYRFLAWSPDSQRIVYSVYEVMGGQTAIRQVIVEVDGSGEQVVELGDEVSDLSFPQFWDNDALFLSTPDGVLRVDLEADEQTVALPDVPAPASLSPDAEQVAAVSADDLMLYDAASGDAEMLIEDMPGISPSMSVSFASFIQWSPDGEYLSGTLRLIEPLFAETTPETTPDVPLRDEVVFTARADGTDYTVLTASSDLTLSWSPDSRYITYTVSPSAENYQIAVAQPDGSSDIILTSEGNNSQPSWRPVMP